MALRKRKPVASQTSTDGAHTCNRPPVPAEASCGGNQHVGLLALALKLTGRRSRGCGRAQLSHFFRLAASQDEGAAAPDTALRISEGGAGRAAGDA